MGTVPEQPPLRMGQGTTVVHSGPRVTYMYPPIACGEMLIKAGRVRLSFAITV